jgi:hypothetical protein
VTVNATNKAVLDQVAQGVALKATPKAADRRDSALAQVFVPLCAFHQHRQNVQLVCLVSTMLYQELRE